jgi:hypothetical protein
MPSSDEKLSFDAHLIDVYLTGLQSEIEAKLRRVAKFRAQVQKMGAWRGQTDRQSRARAARALIAQVQEMLATNLMVRETLEELLTATKALLRDLKEGEG